MPQADSDYVVGPAPTQQSHTARFEYKAADPDLTGGGYPRWRSYEWRPHTTRKSKEDVYVPVHRLAAIAWLFPDDWSAADVLASEELVGADVHHELGMPSANIEGELTLYDHGRHSEITQSEMRAWGADAKRQAEADTEADTCGRCGEAADTLCISPDFDGKRCPSCTKTDSDGSPIEVL